MKQLKIILFIVLVLLLVHGLGYAQSATDIQIPKQINGSNVAEAYASTDSVKPEKKLTAADSIISTAKFEESVKKTLEGIDAKVAELQKQFDALSTEKTVTLKTFYAIYCERNKVDPSKVTVKGVTKEGVVIQTRK